MVNKSCTKSDEKIYTYIDPIIQIFVWVKVNSSQITAKAGLLNQWLGKVNLVEGTDSIKTRVAVLDQEPVLIARAGSDIQSRFR